MSKKLNRDGHVSMWPSYHNKSNRDRGLSFLTPIVDDKNIVGYKLIVEDCTEYIVESYSELVSLGFSLDLDIYVYQIFGHSGFIWFDEAIESNAQVVVAQSSNICTMISVTGERRRTIKIISTAAWGFNCPPTLEIIHALRRVFKIYNHGVHPSASSLGYSAMIDWHKTLGLKKFSRPSSMLRQKLYKFGSGGRVDDFDLSYHYNVKYESDISNSYASQSVNGVPTDGSETIRLLNWYTDDLSELEEYSVAFCQSRITIPSDVPIRKFSPFYTRNEQGQLHWMNQPGVYYGWYWSKMLKRCIECGYKVEIAFCWCWRSLDTFLQDWVYEIVALREYFRYNEMSTEEEISKRIIVTAIGRFAMRDSRLTIISEKNVKEGDERWLNLQVSGNDSMLTKYYVRKVDQPNSNHLTQVAYFIIMCNNIELYDRCIAEEMSGNIVLKTYFDSVTTAYPPTQPVGRRIGQWKVKKLKK